MMMMVMIPTVVAAIMTIIWVIVLCDILYVMIAPRLLMQRRIQVQPRGQPQAAEGLVVHSWLELYTGDLGGHGTNH